MFHRCAILLDELDLELDNKDSIRDSSNIQGSKKASPVARAADIDMLTGQKLDLSMAGRQVVVELKTSNALPLLKYACSNRVMALPTSQLNAQRVSVTANGHCAVFSASLHVPTIHSVTQVADQHML